MRRVFVHFFEESLARKKCFEIIWPLACLACACWVVKQVKINHTHEYSCLMWPIALHFRDNRRGINGVFHLWQIHLPIIPLDCLACAYWGVILKGLPPLANCLALWLSKKMLIRHNVNETYLKGQQERDQWRFSSSANPLSGNCVSQGLTSVWVRSVDPSVLPLFCTIFF